MDKRLIGGSGGINNLMPAKYQWAWKLVNDSIANTWFHHETAMTREKHDYDFLLPEKEKEIFLNVFATLTTSDVVIMRNVAASIMRHITAPEVELYLGRQITEEATHCYSEDTEILTPDGWKLFRDLEPWDKVAQYGSDGTVTFVTPEEMIIADYEGPMYNFKGAKLDLLVTPNHRMVHLDSRNNDALTITTADRCSLRNSRVPVSGMLRGGHKLFSDLDRLRIAFQADGSFGNPNSNNGAITGQIMYRFGFKRQDKIARLINILDSAKIKYKTTDTNNKGYTHFYVWLPMDVPLFKDFSWVNLEDIDSLWISQFIEELQYWDGCPRDNGSILYSSVNLKCVEKIETLAQLCGYRTGRYVIAATENTQTCYQVHICKKSYISGRCVDRHLQHYCGKIYCVTVPTGMVLVRRNNMPAVCGNSITYQHIIEVLCLDEDSIYSRYLTVKEINDKFEYAKLQTDKIDQFDSLESFLEGLFFYYMMFEGVWFYNGFSPIFSIGRRNIMPGTTTQLQFILKDEANHVAFGVKLLKGIFEETEFRLSEETAHRIVRESIGLESNYANRVIQPILGYNQGFHIEQAKYIANRRLKQLGYNELYPGAQNALPWLDEMVNVNKEKNFFETRVTEYQSAASLDGTW